MTIRYWVVGEQPGSQVLCFTFTIPYADVIHVAITGDEISVMQWGEKKWYKVVKRRRDEDGFDLYLQRVSEKPW